MLVKMILPLHGSPIAATEFVLWDGPPGCGKSQALSELVRNLTPSQAQRGPAGQVIQDVQLVSPLNEEHLFQGLIVDSPPGSDTQVVTGWDATTGQAVRWTGRREAWNMFRRPVLSGHAVAQTEWGELLRLRVAQPNFRDPQSLLAPVAAVGPLDSPQSLLHLIPYNERNIIQELNAAIGPLCGVQVCWDNSQVTRWCLRVGTPPQGGSARQQAAAWERLPRVDEQPRSLQIVISVVLCSLLLPGRLLLWDDAGQGLDSQTATLLGMWLGRHARQHANQWFMAACSEPLVRGLVASGAEVTCVRMRKNGDEIRLRAVEPPSLRAVHQSPWIALQQAESLACADAVILTESEVERAIYRLLVDHFAPRPAWWHVLHSYGPGFGPTVYQTVKTTGVPVAVVSTLDLLAYPERFTEWCRLLAGGEPPHEWLLLRDRIAQAVEGALDPQQLAENRRRVETFLDRWRAGQTQAAPAWEESVRATAEQWRAVRYRGLEAVPAAARHWAETLLEGLKRAGMFLSPIGVVRNWFHDGQSKPAGHWFEDAVQRLRQGDCPAPLQAAFREMVTWLQARID